MILAGCQKTVVVGTNARDTGGGAISAHEGHSTLREGHAMGTGSSAAARGQGSVPGSGAPAAPGNAYSPSESNGGRPVGAVSNAAPAAAPVQSAPQQGGGVGSTGPAH